MTGNERETLYGIAMSVTGAKWVMNVMLYRDRDEAERHANNLRAKNFVPENIEVVEIHLPKVRRN